MTRPGHHRSAALSPCVLTVVLAAALLAAPPAQACADAGCEYTPPPLIAELKGGKACYGLFGMGVPFLNPYNDTRANLALLLQDRKLLTLASRPPADPAPTPPAAGTLGPPAPYSVPFRMEDLRERRSDTVDPPPPPPEQPELLALAARLGVAAPAVDEALTRLAAARTGRCAAENPAMVLDFLRAAAGEPGLADAERSAIVGERLRITGRCLEAAEPPQTLATTTPGAAAFVAYLAAARQFYRDELDAAAAGFAALAASPSPWVKETAAYMVARIRMNLAQLHAFKEYGEFDPAAVDAAMLARARADFHAYLDAYPAGRYAASARGLFRRLDWLGGDGGAFVGDLATALADADRAHPAAERVFELLEEIDGKYLSTPGTGSPLAGDDIPWQVPELAATTVLTRMRDIRPDPNGSPMYQPVAADLLAQHKAALAPAATPRLFDYLALADAYWVEHDPARVVEATEGRSPSAGMDNADFAAFVLRGIALEHGRRLPDANALWRQLLERSGDDRLRADFIQLALALNDERSGKLAEIFAAGSPVRDPALHRPLLKQAAPPELLRGVVARADSTAEDKSTALFTLLYKQLVHGDHKGFGETLASFPPGRYDDIDGLHLFLWKGQGAPDYACPALAESVRRLAASADDPAALNCVSEFFLRFDDSLAPGAKPPEDELGGTQDGFAGKTRTRLDYYLAVIGNPKARGDAEAYALHRAIGCFASSGNNHCGVQDIPKEQRKRWFDRLKQTYKDNAWGRQQKFWW